MSSSITVFVVDHDASMRRALERLMKAAGYRAACESSVEELFERDLPADGAVILVDLGTASDFSNVSLDRLHGQGQTLPVIYLTDHDTDQARRQARRIGAAGYFRKPIDQQALIDAISFAVRQPEMTKVR